jgi:hypothetical protein
MRVATLVLMMLGSVAGLPQAPTNAPAAETGTQFYMRYQAAVARASTIDEVTAFWRADAVKEFSAAPPAERVDLAVIKRMYGIVSNVKVTHETVTGSTDEATLTLEGTGKDQKTITGTAHLVKENGAWKLVGPEVWR